MKKFFGLKMALAVLAAGAFVSCTDSEAGDIYIPTPSQGGTTPTPTPTVVVELPEPIYVVSGVVTDFVMGSAIADVAVTGAVEASTDANGYFTTGAQAAPVNGVVTFTKEGYNVASRTVSMVTLAKGQGSLNSVLNVALVPEGYDPSNPGGDKPEPGPGPAPEEPTPFTDEEVELVNTTDPLPIASELKTVDSAAGLAAMGADFTNDTDEPVTILIDAKSLNLPYGAVVASAKATIVERFIAWVKSKWGNDPYEGYGVYTGYLEITVPAKSKITAVKVMPVLFSQNYVFTITDEEGAEQVLENTLDIIDSYQVDGTFEALAEEEPGTPTDPHSGDVTPSTPDTPDDPHSGDTPTDPHNPDDPHATDPHNPHDSHAANGGGGAADAD